jgi:DNA-binding transcriptional LysR family regulator
VLQQAKLISTRLTVSQILAVIAVAKSGSLLMAARDGGLSVSALHRATREIESRLGYPIFQKTPTGLNVNRAGAELARRLQIALREIAVAEEEIHSLSGPINGRILIGTLPMIRSSLLGQAINRTLAEAPGLRFEVQEGIYAAMLGALRGGDVDMLIGALRNPPPADGVEQRLLFVDPYAVIARKGHPLFERAVDIGELARFEWVAQKRGTPVRAALQSLFEGSPFDPTVAVETSSMSLSRSILLHSDRLCVLSRRQIAIEEQAGLLSVLPNVLPSKGRSIGLTTRVDWLPGQSHRLFLKNFYAVLMEEVGTVNERL